MFVFCLSSFFIFIGVELLYNVVFLLYNEVHQLYVYVYPLLPGPPNHPPNPPQSTELSHLCFIAASHQLCLLHMVVHLCQFSSPHSSRPLPPVVFTCPSRHLHLFLPANRFIWTFSAAATAKSLQSCPTLCDPIDGSPPGSPRP